MSDKGSNQPEPNYARTFRSLLASVSRPNEAWLEHLTDLRKSNYPNSTLLTDQIFAIYACSLLEGEFSLRKNGKFEELKSIARRENSQPMNLAVRLSDLFFGNARIMLSCLDRSDMEALWIFRTNYCHATTDGIDNGRNRVLWFSDGRIVEDKENRDKRWEYYSDSYERGDPLESHMRKIRDKIENLPTIFWMIAKYVCTPHFLSEVYHATQGVQIMKIGITGNYLKMHEHQRFLNMLGGSDPQPLNFKEFVTLEPNDPRQWW